MLGKLEQPEIEDLPQVAIQVRGLKASNLICNFLNT